MLQLLSVASIDKTLGKITSNSDLSSISDDDSEYNFIPGLYGQFETENDEESDSDMNGTAGVDRAYQDEPLADKEWITQYKQELEEKRKRLESLKDRLTGKESIKTW